MNIDENYPYLYKENYEKVRNKCRRRKTIALCSNDKSRRKIVYIGYKDSKFIKELKASAPQLLQYLIGSPIAVGAIVAIIMNKLIPLEK